MPMALMSIVLAPVVGKLTDRVHPRILITGFGFTALLVSPGLAVRRDHPGLAVWQILLPMALFGVGNAVRLGAVSATATRNLPMHQAGAGAGVYNATRQVGAVLGSAAIAVLMDARLAAQGWLVELHPGAGRAAALPDAVQAPFSEAMGQALLLPAAVFLLGLVAALFFERPRHVGFAPPSAADGGAAADQRA